MEHPSMAERICFRCGNPATGYASVWTAEHGERWYCHGDEDAEPTCYEQGQRAPESSCEHVEFPLSLLQPSAAVPVAVRFSVFRSL